MEVFYRPFAELRDRKKGSAVSLIKAGLNVLGKPVGKARAPLVNPSPEEEAQLKTLVAKGLSLIHAG